MSISFQSISSLNSTTSAHNRLDVLVEAKNDYTKQLKDYLVGPIYQGFIKIYTDAKTKCEEQGIPDQRLRKFQDYVSRIPKWTKEELVTECKRIVKLSKCDWIDLLITAVFVTHAKIHASVKDDTVAYKNVMLTIPKLNLFLHNCYIECARKMWKNAYLYDDIKITDSEYQRNIRDIETLIQESIDINIRQSLPVKDLLKEYLGDNILRDHIEEVDITSISKLSEENMKNMLKKEFEDITKDFDKDDITIGGPQIETEDTISFIINNSKTETSLQVSTIENNQVKEEEAQYESSKLEHNETDSKNVPEYREVDEVPITPTNDHLYESEKTTITPTNDHLYESKKTTETPEYNVEDHVEDIHVEDNVKVIEFQNKKSNTMTKPVEPIEHIPMDILGKLMQETRDIIDKRDEVDIDMLSISDVPKVKKNSNSIKQLLDESHSYSATTSKRKKKYSTFMLRN